ncbi:hypothetical protein LZ24_01201 [Desulfobotulus alkaliphilus]|uniref:Uncharacterized protein n=1 Tax=Desulfobotulus alkaliphilus TaxID=622671 RepID=A0A562RY49_9BACT|nr:hypothetical protein [Desulfobotulus alkaliphilus]TWI73971.1 hypothetical protein LZ24_01201 [Desulfobotulus alkaliphilus]
MGKRHETIGIKQTIRFDWMQKTVNLLMAGLDQKAVRQELHDYLSEKKGSGAEEERGKTSRSQAVNILMNIWVSPDQELLLFRDAALTFLREHPSLELAAHWAMISAAYPFWFNVARQTGRLLALQDQVTHKQISTRLKEQYGDRETVSRYARYVIRSFVAWGVLKDLQVKGCYGKNPVLKIEDARSAGLIFESALLATPEAKIPMGLLLNNPAFFPFQVPVVTGDSISRSYDRIELIRYGLDDELLKLYSA